MANPESFQHYPEPQQPAELPPELAEFLADREFACLTYPTDRGTSFVIKAPSADIANLAGSLPITIRHELFEHPTAPVIRIVTTIYDQPDSPLALETFLNVEDPQQRADYEALTQQEELFMLFYDEELHHRLTKRVAGTDHDHITEVLRRAVEYAQALPAGQYSFDIAKASVMERTSL